MKKVFIFLADGFEELEAIAPIDILRRADIPIVSVSLTDSKTVTGAHRIKVMADQLFSETDFSDNAFLVLPGGGEGTKNLAAHKQLNELLLHQFERNKNLAAICAAPSVFGNLGILSGKEATCYPGFEEKLVGAEISGQTVVKSENIITAKGPGVAIQFALKIVETLKGSEVAHEIAKQLIF
ncbi:MAG: hypothetical protein H6Q19_787 [Bacteroidetes bacterium]|nr:hypothetical protein [Bacteroidota bacterium]